jgi:hypothetical protein
LLAPLRLCVPPAPSSHAYPYRRYLTPCPFRLLLTLTYFKLFLEQVRYVLLQTPFCSCPFDSLLRLTPLFRFSLNFHLPSPSHPLVHNLSLPFLTLFTRSRPPHPRTRPHRQHTGLSLSFFTPLSQLPAPSPLPAELISKPKTRSHLALSQTSTDIVLQDLSFPSPSFKMIPALFLFGALAAPTAMAHAALWDPGTLGYKRRRGRG